MKPASYQQELLCQLEKLTNYTEEFRQLILLKDSSDETFDKLYGIQIQLKNLSTTFLQLYAETLLERAIDGANLLEEKERIDRIINQYKIIVF